MVYPNGDLQPHELEDHDEFICRCGEWVPIKEAPRVKEHYRGTWVVYRCRECLRHASRWHGYLRTKRRRERALRTIYRKLMEPGSRHLCSPDAAARFVSRFNQRVGGVEKLADHIYDISKRSKGLAAINAIQLMIGLTRYIDPEIDAMHRLEEIREAHLKRMERSKNAKKSKFFDLPI